MPPYLRSCDGGVLLDLLVQPRASRSRIVGAHDGRLKVQLAAPPVDGEANEALIEFLSKLLAVPRRSVELRSGETGRRKTLRILGVSCETAAGALASKDA